MPDSPSGADDLVSPAPEARPEQAADNAQPDSRRTPLLVAAACAATLALGIVWIIVTALIALHKLNDAQSELPHLKQALLSGQQDKARALAADIRDNADSAHALVSGPAWWVASNLPVVGTPLRTARTIASAARGIGHNVLPGVSSLESTVQASSLHSGKSINLAPLAKAAGLVSRADTASADVLARILATNKSSWLPIVDHSRADLAKQLTRFNGELSGASRALNTALPMMGQSGLRRYFVGFENEAEARGLGGLPGAFAIVTADHGTFSFTHYGNDTELLGVSTGLNLGADYAARYQSASPTTDYRNSDIGPDFRDAARIWSAMWTKKSGQHIDGAIALDPTALSYLLKVTGPAALPGGGQVTYRNVVALTQQTEYSRFADTAQRKAFVVAVSDAAASRVTSGAGSPTALLKAISYAARNGRILVWSARPAEEANLILAKYAGALIDDGSPFAGFTVVNAAGSKLDYYLGRTMTYARASCAAGSSATATLQLHNNAPRSGLPAYVTIRNDKPKYPTKPGDNFEIITYYGTVGSQITSVEVDGHAIGVSVGSEHGLRTVSFGLELPVQTTRTVTITLREPATQGRVRTYIQPGVNAEKVSVSQPTCAG